MRVETPGGDGAVVGDVGVEDGAVVEVGVVDGVAVGGTSLPSTTFGRYLLYCLFFVIQRCEYGFGCGRFVFF